VLLLALSEVNAFVLPDIKRRLLDKRLAMKADPRLQYNLGRIAFSGLTLAPEAIGRRKTLLKEIVKGKIWTLDQIQGIINVNGKLISDIKHNQIDFCRSFLI
jgi:hypothetical protein